MEASTAIQSRLIGAILVQKNLVTAEQLEHALKLQAETGERLGEIVVAEFGVSRLELASVLAEQWAELENAERSAAIAPPQLVPVEPLAPDTPLIRRPIGEIFVELGFVSNDQLDAALDVQRETGARIGEILVEQGSLTRLDLASALAEQWSALQKLRPPAPVAEPQPWQNGIPVAQPTDAGWSAEDRAILVALEERLRVVERSTTATPWQEDLRLVAADLRSALGAVEERLAADADERARSVVEPALAAVVQRLAALESTPVESELEALRRELDDQRARPATVEGLEELRAAVERLESRPDREDELTSLGRELGALAARIDSLTPAPDLTERLEAVAGQAEAGIAGLSGRIDELTGLERRLDGLAAQLPDEGAIEELRRALADLNARAEFHDTPHDAAEVASLVARLDRLEARVEDVTTPTAPAPDLTPRIDHLAGRIDEVAASIPILDSDGLTTRLDALEALAGREPDLAPLQELRGRVDRLAELVGREPDAAPLEELRERLDGLAVEVAAAVGREPDLAPLQELRGRVDRLAELAGREPDAAPLEELRERLDGLAVEVAAAVGREPDLAPLHELRGRVDRLAELVGREPDAAPLEELRARIEELAAHAEQDGMAVRLESRIADLEQRVAAAAPDAELREELRRVAESTVAERQSLAQALYLRVEEITAAMPHEDELGELRSRLDELAARPTDDALVGRVDELGSRIDVLVGLEGAVSGLRESLAALDALRVADALATGARLAGLESSISSLESLTETFRPGLLDDVAGRAEATAARLDHVEGRLQAVGAFEIRIAALAAELEQRPDDATLTRVTDELRTELDALAARPTIADPSDQLRELSERIDRIARDGHERIGGLTEGLQDLAGRTDAFVTRDDAAATAAEQAAWVRGELDAVRAAGAGRSLSLEESVAKSEQQRTEAERQLADRIEDAIAGVRADLEAHERKAGARLDENIGGMRAELEAHTGGLASAIEAQRHENANLHGRIDALVAAAEEHAGWEGRFENTLERRLSELAERLGGEVAATRAEALDATAAVRGEIGLLTARVDEMLALRQTDVHAARAANEELAARVDALAGLRADDAEAARFAADDLSHRLESLAGSLQAEATGARGAAEAVAAQVASLHALRSDDLAAAELAGVELAGRLDDHATRSAAAAGALERALREELGGLAARLEERDVQGIEAREELRGELERVASSVGWRLERIEESLAADDTVELKAAVADLTRRLDGQAAIGEEQARATERALRKGLASLGEKLADSESAYVDAGNALRRSIERLGAAVVEADARMADQIPVAEAEGCVAFAPTSTGYRLVELPGTPPELGSTIEIEAVDGALVVTRYGRSPLPLDSRPCAYLDRA